MKPPPWNAPSTKRWSASREPGPVSVPAGQVQPDRGGGPDRRPLRGASRRRPRRHPARDRLPAAGPAGSGGGLARRGTGVVARLVGRSRQRPADAALVGRGRACRRRRGLGQPALAVVGDRGRRLLAVGRGGGRGAASAGPEHAQPLDRAGTGGSVPCLALAAGAAGSRRTPASGQQRAGVQPVELGRGPRRHRPRPRQPGRAQNRLRRPGARTRPSAAQGLGLPDPVAAGAGAVLVQPSGLASVRRPDRGL